MTIFEYLVFSYKAQKNYVDVLFTIKAPCAFIHTKRKMWQQIQGVPEG